ncbi:MAG: DUF3597 domain-containing protein [Burkholderiaceae bacterium]
MGILSNIFSKIFPSSHAASTPAATSASAAQVPGASSPPAGPTTGAASTPTPAPAPMAEVDVEKMLNEKAKQSSEKLNWRTSIVDLMKLLGIDSSLTARKELAKELNYTGDTNDSASMNIWLHRQVMNKIAANGGKVPADLKD